MPVTLKRELKDGSGNPTVYGVVNGKRMVLISLLGTKREVADKLADELTHSWIYDGHQENCLILAVCQIDLPWWRKFLADATGPSAAKTVFRFSPGAPMPLGFTLDENELLLLKTLHCNPWLSAIQIGTLLKEPEPMDWMGRFLDRLAGLGLDLITTGDDLDGEPTYILTR